MELDMGGKDIYIYFQDNNGVAEKEGNKGGPSISLI
jgi:hypothetical protein